MNSTVIDASAREAAINPNKSFIVQAPAGSGKTELLTDRILALLAIVDRPEEIISITFTRKAAAEMHSRVIEKLKSGLREMPEQDYKQKSWCLARQVISRDQQLGWGLLQNPARLKIRTIDALCSYLVKAMPYLSAFGGMPDTASNEQAQAMYRKAAIDTIGLIDSYSQIKVLVEHLDVNLNSCINLIVEMLRQRDQWLELVHDEIDIDVLQDTLTGIINRQLKSLSNSMPHKWNNDLQPILQMAANTLNNPESVINCFANWDGEVFEHGFEAVNFWSNLADVLLTKEGSLRKNFNKNLGFTPKSVQKEQITDWIEKVQISDETIEKLAQIRTLPKSGYDDNHKFLLDNFLHLLLIAHAQLQLCFSQNNQVDFIEIAQRALHAIGTEDNPTDLLLVLDSRINHILVDEFQDTSYSQVHLLETLVSGWQDGDGRSLFLVGDPMQSIYRFRKAEVGLFLKTRDYGIGPVQLETLQLQQNFRSKANLVHSINYLFKGVFPKLDDIELGAISYSTSQPFDQSEAENNLYFYPIEIDSHNDENNIVDTEINSHATEDQTVLQIIKQSLEKYKDCQNPVAILVRSRKHLNNVVQLLINAGIPCKAVEIDSLAQQQVVDDIVQLARALSHKDDRLAWLSVLRSPLCGLSLNSLHALFGETADIDNQQTIAQTLQSVALKIKQDYSSVMQLLSEPELHRLLHASTVLLDQSNVSGAIPFVSWLQSCWQRLNGDRIYASENDQANIERVFMLIEQLAPYGQLDFEELNQAIKNLYAQSTTTGPAVEIMTIHKSKGLEFESVVVMGLNRASPSSKGTLIDYEQVDGQFLLGPIKRSDEDKPDAISEFIKSRHNIRSRNELDRVLYVALTRARSELHLTAIIDKKKDGSPKLASGGFLCSLYDGLLSKANVVKNTSFLENKTAILQNNLMVQNIKELPDMQELFQRLNAKQENYISGWNWDSKRISEQIIGTVAHEWLERIALEGVENWSIKRLEQSNSLLTKHLSRAGILSSEMQNAVLVLYDTLAKTLQSERGKWLLSVAKAYREWSLMDLSGRVSIIDLAISQENNWLIVDYKTSVPAQNETIDDFKQRMLNTYSEQLNRYINDVQLIDGRQAKAALYFPRVDLWLALEKNDFSIR